MDISKSAMGKEKEIKVTLEGLTGIFQTLAREHGEASALLRRAAKSSNAAEWRETFPKARTQLIAHERGELAVLYPKLLAREDTRGLAEDHNQEAKEMESLLDELSASDFDDGERPTRVQKLISLVEHHTSEEESDYFPKAQSALGKETAEGLESTYTSKKKEILREIH